MSSSLGEKREVSESDDGRATKLPRSSSEEIPPSKDDVLLSRDPTLEDCRKTITEKFGEDGWSLAKLAMDDETRLAKLISGREALEKEKERLTAGLEARQEDISPSDDEGKCESDFNLRDYCKDIEEATGTMWSLVLEGLDAYIRLAEKIPSNQGTCESASMDGECRDKVIQWFWTLAKGAGDVQTQIVEEISQCEVLVKENKKFSARLRGTDEEEEEEKDTCEPDFKVGKSMEKVFKGIGGLHKIAVNAGIRLSEETFRREALEEENESLTARLEDAAQEKARLNVLLEAAAQEKKSLDARLEAAAQERASLSARLEADKAGLTARLEAATREARENAVTDCEGKMADAIRAIPLAFRRYYPNSSWNPDFVRSVWAFLETDGESLEIEHSSMPGLDAEGNLAGVSAEPVDGASPSSPSV